MTQLESGVLRSLASLILDGVPGAPLDSVVPVKHLVEHLEIVLLVWNSFLEIVLLQERGGLEETLVQHRLTQRLDVLGGLFKPHGVAEVLILQIRAVQNPLLREANLLFGDRVVGQLFLVPPREVEHLVNVNI